MASHLNDKSVLIAGASCQCGRTAFHIVLENLPVVSKKTSNIFAQHWPTKGDVLKIRQPKGFPVFKLRVVAGFGNDIKEESKVFLCNPSREERTRFVGYITPAHIRAS